MINRLVNKKVNKNLICIIDILNETNKNVLYCKLDMYCIKD